MTSIIDFKDLEKLAGQELGTSDWHLIDQKRVNAFAEATNDYQWVHVDEERATKELGGTIAHGFLTLSLLPMLLPEILEVRGVRQSINYGANRIRFVSAVPTGSNLRLKASCLSVEDKPMGKQLTVDCTIEIQGEEKPACVAETMVVLVG